jgi:acetylornithine deacetylase/succinyl-diaminopimelate desuccinylase-like protein
VSTRRRDVTTERMAADRVLASVGRRHAFGEPGFSAYERAALRPALDINGLLSGHVGPGAKGIVPGRAVAKLSFRLVPDQEPHKVARLLARHIERRAPRGVDVRVRFSKATRPVRVDPRSPALGAARAALKAGFANAPVMLASGGTIPVVELLAAHVGDPVLMGFALPDDGMHGANERIDLERLAAGAACLVRFLALVGVGHPRALRGDPDIEAPRRLGQGVRAR